MSNTNSFSKVLKLTQLAILSAIIILMTVVPYLGYISYGWLSITIIHIPVIIGAVVMGPGAGSALGAVWGITCTLKALLAPPSPLDGMIFQKSGGVDCSANPCRTCRRPDFRMLQKIFEEIGQAVGSGRCGTLWHNSEHRARDVSDIFILWIISGD